MINGFSLIFEFTLQQSEYCAHGLSADVQIYTGGEAGVLAVVGLVLPRFNSTIS